MQECQEILRMPLDFPSSHHSFTSLWLPFFFPPPRPQPPPWQRHRGVEETGEEAWTKRTRATERRTPAEPKRRLTRRTFSRRWLAINEVSNRGRRKKKNTLPRARDESKSKLGMNLMRTAVRHRFYKVRWIHPGPADPRAESSGNQWINANRRKMRWFKNQCWFGGNRGWGYHHV